MLGYIYVFKSKFSIFYLNTFKKFSNTQTALFKHKCFLILDKNNKYMDDMLSWDYVFFFTLYEEFGWEKRYCSSICEG